MSSEDLNAFRQVVLGDVRLQMELRELVDRDAFIACMVQLGGEQGFMFDAGEVEVTLLACRQAWFMRWIEG